MIAFLTVTTRTSYMKDSCTTGTVITATITVQFQCEPEANIRSYEWAGWLLTSLPEFLLSLLLNLTASLLGAYLLYLTVERPAQEWAKRIRYKVGGARDAEVLTGTTATYVNSEVDSYVPE
jgi:hypothetical protein